MAWFTPIPSSKQGGRSMNNNTKSKESSSSASVMAPIPRRQTPSSSNPTTPTRPTTGTNPHPPERYMPWAMQLMGPLCCENCGAQQTQQHRLLPPPATTTTATSSFGDNNGGNSGGDSSPLYCMPLGSNPFIPATATTNTKSDDDDVVTDVAQFYQSIYSSLRDEKKNKRKKTDTSSTPTTTSAISPYIIAPMSIQPSSLPLNGQIDKLLMDYHKACQLYDTSVNSGILASIRYALPTMRASGPFHDQDMMALADLWMMNITNLKHVLRLDFRRASKEGKGVHRWYGFRSHGAFALAKMLSTPGHSVEQVFLQRHRIGPYGAAAIFTAIASSNNCQSLKLLWMRRCKIGEGGALAAAETICLSRNCRNLREVDLSANQIGYRGCLALERALQQRSILQQQNSTDRFPQHLLSIDMEGNLVFQEVMNGVTHGLGVLFAICGMIALGTKVQHSPARHRIACTIYSTSLFVLYTSSTLYHSFFSMQHTKYIFEVLDKCAIYILIAGSYTPFLQIVVWDYVWWSNDMLAFMWLCCFLGICVEFMLPDWKHKMVFSLSMYLGMGWVSIVCLPQLTSLLTEDGALHLLILGGVGYTSGVPFFVRNNNLDHSIWHLFVLAGSIFHWACIYIYVAGWEKGRSM